MAVKKEMINKNKSFDQDDNDEDLDKHETYGNNVYVFQECMLLNDATSK